MELDGGVLRLIIAFFGISNMRPETHCSTGESFTWNDGRNWGFLSRQR